MRGKGVLHHRCSLLTQPDRRIDAVLKPSPATSFAKLGARLRSVRGGWRLCWRTTGRHRNDNRSGGGRKVCRLATNQVRASNRC